MQKCLYTTVNVSIGLYRHGNSVLCENLLVDNVHIMKNERPRHQIFTPFTKAHDLS